MTQYELAVIQMEALKEAFLISLNFWVICSVLIRLNKRDNSTKCYAPVELSGMLCIIPEFTWAFLLTIPLLLMYLVTSIDVDIVAVNGIYLCSLWIFRRCIIKGMRLIF